MLKKFKTWKMCFLSCKLLNKSKIYTQLPGKIVGGATKKGFPPKSSIRGMNLGKLYIFGKVLERTSGCGFKLRIFTNSGAPSGENVSFAI